MKPPKSLNQEQRLTGRVAAFNRFVFKSIDKCPSFFRVLRKIHDFPIECEKTFVQLKEYLSNPPLLSQTKQGETLYLYLLVTSEVVSSALVREEEKLQRPVYYTSRALRGAETRYPWMELLAFALVVATRQLRSGY